MLGIEAFIRRFSGPNEAQKALMDHFAEKARVRRGWDRRYAHMQFVLQFGPRFRHHASRRAA